MKNKTKKQQEKCSMDEEMLMWTSYRYCIGRKTYVSSLANGSGVTTPALTALKSWPWRCRLWSSQTPCMIGSRRCSRC